MFGDPFVEEDAVIISEDDNNKKKADLKVVVVRCLFGYFFCYFCFLR